MGRAFVGIGGWTYEPWRGTFFPEGLPHKRELAHAASRVTAIEINATFYREQSRTSFQRWHDETPPGFRFTAKASMFATNRKDLRQTGDAIARFLGSGLDALGEKLGPILWQLQPTKQLDLDEMNGFLSLLPRTQRHAIEVRHASFATAAFVRLCKKHGVAIVFTDSDDYPSIDERTADFTYARLVRTRDKVKNGYTPRDLDAWATRVRAWDRHGDAYVLFVNGAKEKAPFAAEALLARLAS